MVKVVTLADWEKITLTAVARAKSGDNQARKWLSEYLLGPPVQRLSADVTTAGESLNEGSGLTDDRRIALVAAILGNQED